MNIRVRISVYCERVSCNSRVFVTKTFTFKKKRDLLLYWAMGISCYAPGPIISVALVLSHIVQIIITIVIRFTTKKLTISIHVILFFRLNTNLYVL